MKNIIKNPLFEHVSAESIERMMTCFEIQKKQYKEKETILTYDAVENTIGLLLEGAISVNRIGIDGSLDMLEYMDEAGVFGVSLAFMNGEDAFLVVCEKDCTVLFIAKEHITKRCANACQHHTQVVENLMYLMSEKVALLTEKVDILSHRSIRGKLMRYFRIQSAKQGRMTFQLPMSLLKLANYLCVDRSAMMREMKKMKEESLICMNNGEITLL